jgi:ATP-dependent helicase HepA
MAFLDEYERLARAARGLAAVFAASVELHPHQVRVVQRVLDDPFQRYLLADEVGLGKTIEAGLIIRQRLMDAPRSLVVVFAPSSLVWQWEDELDERLGLRDLRPSGIEVVPYDTDRRAFERHITPDLIVIDEAHRVAAGWASEDPNHLEVFRRATQLAATTPRVLLLSATPALHHERELLAMLHLLDPDTFALNERAATAFERRMRDREHLGGIFARLSDALPPFLRRRALTELTEALPDDGRLVDLAESALEALDGNGGRDRAQRTLAAVRVHVSETYRVHRRMLRTRRQSATETSYRVRGRQGLVLVDDPDFRRDEAEAWLTRWRSTVAAEAEDDPAKRSVAVAVIAMFVERASGDLDAMGALARAMLSLRRSDRLAAGMTTDEGRIARALWPSESLGRLLARLADTLDAVDSGARLVHWVDAVADVLDEHGEKAVLFANARPTVERVTDILRERYGASGVAVLLADQSTDDRRASVGRLRRAPACRALVCDRSGEEGLNLQEAGTVVHLDIPTTSGRLEQRIGRLDRRSDAAPVTSVALAPLEGGLVDAWLRAVDEGFAVFDRSAAPLQYAVDHVEGAFLRSLALDGAGSAVRLLGGLGERVAEEQERIDRVDGLDALAGEASHEAELIAQYEDAEAGTTALADSVGTLVDRCGSELGVGRLARASPSEVSLCIVRDTDPVKRYLGVKQHGSRLVCDREVALTDPEVRLTRPGTPAVDLLRNLVGSADGERTFSVWRQQADGEGPTVAFCCDFLVRADVSRAFAVWRQHERQQPSRARAHRSAADAPLDRAAFQRRVDEHLLPQLIRVWVDSAGEVIPDTSLLEAALADSTAERWPSIAWSRAEVLGNIRSLEAVTDVVADVAKTDALRRARGLADPEGAANNLSEEAERDLLHLQLRAERDRTDVARRELRAMRAVLDAMAVAVRTPGAEEVGAGLVVMAPEPLPGAGT